ncbi:MAG: Rid family detoxifying hydrolase [Candidatus Peribacteraceae bacterium]|nr:Rid family detoxifying hydrolase [Candidatus Peribacteraceae bacterium]
MQQISTPAAPPALGPYSQAIKANGFIFCAGQIPLKPDGTMVEGGIREQTMQVLRNQEAVLKAAGSSFEKIVNATVYLADLNDFAGMNEVYAEFFKGMVPPARVTIQVAALPKGAKVEIAFIAVV